MFHALTLRFPISPFAMPADIIDYQIVGDDMQAVIITLDPRETVLAEAGAMLYMQDGIVMNTTLDPNAQNSGLLGKIVSGAKRALSGDSFFVTTFSNQGSRRQDVAFSAPYPGRIQPLELSEWGGTVLAQKDAFLCAARGIEVSIAFNKRIGAGFFGGEGFILQRIHGDGLAFVHASGTLIEHNLAAGETLRVDTGCLVAMEQTVDYDIQMVPGLKSKLFGGEGLFFTRLTGPGRVILQSMPFSRLADRILAAAPSAGGKRVGEGSVLGGLGGLLDGDN